MDVNTVVSVASALIAVGSLYIAFRKSKPEIKVMNSQEQLNLASALRQAAEALSVSMAASAKERGELEARIDELEAHREQRTKEIEEQNKEIVALRTEITAMRIDEQQKTTRLVAKLEAWEQWFTKVAEILKEHNIEIPERADILKDSQPKIPRIKT
jgi:hypothetical protein